MAIEYAVDGCHDDQGALLNALHRISEEAVVLLVLHGSPRDLI